MKQTKALLWKEWHQHRILLLGGVGLFVLFSFVGFLINGWSLTRWTTPEEAVLFFGGILAIIVAVRSVCHELAGGLGVFWRSRPVSPQRWLLSKYFAGLTTVLLVCTAILALKFFFMNLLTNHVGHFAVVVLLCHSFSLILIFSVAFLLGCLVRHSANAAFLSIGAMLLIYFLPIILPPLKWMSLYEIMTNTTPQTAYGLSYYVFVVTMLIGSGIALYLALKGVQRDRRLRTDQKTLCWSIVIVMLVLLASAGFQIGTNMNPEKIISIPGKMLPDSSRYTESIALDGDEGVVLVHERKQEYPYDSTFSIFRFDLSKTGTTLSSPICRWFGHNYNDLMWSAKHKNRAFLLQRDIDEKEKIRVGLYLLTFRLDSLGPDPDVSKFDIYSYLPNKSRHSIPHAHLYKDKIYVYDNEKLLVADIQNPDAPKVLKVMETGNMGIRENNINSDMKRFQVKMIPSEELSISERLTLGSPLLPSRWDLAAGLDNDLLVTSKRTKTGMLIETFRLVEIKDDSATFELVGQRKATPLEQLMSVNPDKMLVRDGLAYCFERGHGITVYDMRQPEKPKRVGHYVAGEQIWAIAGLSKGRVLIGGQSNLHIVLPPPRISPKKRDFQKNM